MFKEILDVIFHKIAIDEALCDSYGISSPETIFSDFKKLLKGSYDA